MFSHSKVWQSQCPEIDPNIFRFLNFSKCIKDDKNKTPGYRADNSLVLILFYVQKCVLEENLIVSNYFTFFQMKKVQKKKIFKLRESCRCSWQNSVEQAYGN